MPKKKESSSSLPVVRNPNITTAGVIGPGIEDISSEGKYRDILENPNLSPSQKKRAILREKGILGTRQKYESPTARKEAAKVRAKTKKEQRQRLLEAEGIVTTTRPKESYAGMSELEKYEALRDKSKVRGEKKRDWGKLAAFALPGTAGVYGISTSQSRKDYGIDIDALREFMLDELLEKTEKGKNIMKGLKARRQG